MEKSYKVNVETQEQLLFEEVKNGSVEAFSKMYENFANHMFNYGRSLTSDNDLIKDCIHDVFVKFFSRKDELSSIENCKAYIFISLKNKIYDEMRKKVNQSDVCVDDLTISNFEDVEHSYIKSESEQYICSSIYSLLKHLSTRQREALTLYYIEERKYEEICEIMSMNYQSVRNLMYRALTKLRALVGNTKIDYSGDWTPSARFLYEK